MGQTMGFFDVPEGSFWLKATSVVCKIEGLVLITLPFTAYWIKWGVAWHDAGTPWHLDDVKFNAYWNMIMIIYASSGFYLCMASYNPARYKSFFSWLMWGGNLGHGIVATVAVFTTNYASSAHEDWLKWGTDSPNGDKMFVAIPIWFGSFLTHLTLAKMSYDSYLFPWDIEAMAEDAAPVGAEKFEDAGELNL